MSLMRLPARVVAALTLVVPAAAAAQDVPDFSGQWVQDIARSKALTERNGEPWRVAGAGTASAGGAASEVPTGEIVQPVTVITQSATELVLELRLDGEIYSRTVLALDGSESVNAERNRTSRSRSVWKNGALVTTGTTRLDFSDGSARDASGRPIHEIVRDVVTTRRLMPDGSMQVEQRSVQDGQERVSWVVFTRVER